MIEGLKYVACFSFFLFFFFFFYSLRACGRKSFLQLFLWDNFKNVTKTNKILITLYVQNAASNQDLSNIFRTHQQVNGLVRIYIIIILILLIIIIVIIIIYLFIY